MTPPTFTTPTRSIALSRAVASVASLALLAGGIFTITGCGSDEPPRERVVYRVAPPPRPVAVQTPYPAAPDPYTTGAYSTAPEPVASNEVVDASSYEPAPPPEVVTTYEQDLQPYGEWVEVPQHGRCWRPANRAANWEPYTVGHWVSTDQGWSWVSENDEANWGYVTYHYGRWLYQPQYGWVWVPGTTYSPAWVSWREGGGYCAWAPLPPEVPTYGASAVIVDRYVPADRYVVVEERYITSPRIYDRVVVRDRRTIINKTVNITKITYVNNRIVNRGVSVKNVERYTGQKVEQVQAVRVTSAEEARRYRAEGRPVVYQPPVVEKAAAQAREVHLQKVQEQNQVHAQRQQQDIAAKQQKQNEQAQRFQQKQDIRAQDHAQDLQQQQQKFQTKEQKELEQQQAHNAKVQGREQEKTAQEQQAQVKEQQRVQAQRDAEAAHQREVQAKEQQHTAAQQQETQVREQKQAVQQQEHQEKVPDREQQQQQRVQERRETPQRETPSRGQQQTPQQQQQQSPRQATGDKTGEKAKAGNGEKNKNGQPNDGNAQNQVR